MGIFISESGNREVWKVKPENYFTEGEWRELHPDKFYSLAGTNSCRTVSYPYDSVLDNEVEMASLPPDDISISDSSGNWVESEDLLKDKFERVKATKLDELNSTFERVSNHAHCTSSAGFEINADETANRNISSLIIAMEATGQETVQFCAFDNTFHAVTLGQLRTMQLEIIANAQAIYAQKWAWREQINVAETIEALDAIEIVFHQGEE